MSRKRRRLGDDGRRTKRPYGKHRPHEELWGPVHTCATPEEDEERRANERHLRVHGFPSPPRPEPRKFVLETLGYETVPPCTERQIITETPLPSWLHLTHVDDPYTGENE